MCKKRRGQSTLEYVIVITAIIAAIIIAASQFLQPKVQGSLEHVSNAMGDQVAKIGY